MDDISAMNPYEAVLRFIELAVEKRGWKPSRLAKEIGMSDSWVSRVLSGDIKLSVPRLLQIAEKLMVQPPSLVPIINHQNKEGSTEPMTFEDYCRKIVREIVKEEVKEALSQK
jgi:transcriptional regulator with XRE-family HTH domain